MSIRRTSSFDEWEDARRELLEAEKEQTRARDAVVARRRRMPWLRLEQDHVLEGPHGPTRLVDVFEGRRQLLLYHFMWTPGQVDACDGCSMFLDHWGHPAHLWARDVTRAVVSPGPLAEIEPFRERMGWDVPWYSALGTGLYDELRMHGGFALNVLVREGDEIHRTYMIDGRGVDYLGSTWSFLDLTPFGRQEEWEDSPPGTPQGPRYEWWHKHDEYPAEVTSPADAPRSTA